MTKEMKIESISRFKYACHISPHKKYHGCFLTRIKTTRFAVPIILFGKWKVSARLQIHPKKI